LSSRDIKISIMTTMGRDLWGAGGLISRYDPLGMDAVGEVRTRCRRWLEETFGIRGCRVLDVRICERNWVDLGLGITVVEFSFETFSGEVMESAAFLTDLDGL